MNPVAITLLLAAALAAFCALAWRKLAIVVKLAPEVRWDHPPRAILAELTCDAPLEFPLRREKAMCCGAGGARMWMDEKIGRRINLVRFEQALPQQPRVIATACPYCATMMSDAVKAQTCESDIETRDIVELVASALAES